MPRSCIVCKNGREKLMWHQDRQVDLLCRLFKQHGWIGAFLNIAGSR
jgi:hypothetical protein